jgi:PEP-CTERM motif
VTGIQAATPSNGRKLIMMQRLARLGFSWLVVSAFAGASNTIASPIAFTDSATQYQWLQVSLFTNSSWDALNAACPGGRCLAGAEINGIGVGGYMWATSAQVDLMLSDLLGSPDTSSDQVKAASLYATLASAFTPTYGANSPAPVPGVNTLMPIFVNGYVSDSRVNGFDSEVWAGVVYVDHGGGFFFNISNLIGNDATAQPNYIPAGAWLFDGAPAAAPVPEPSTVALCGIGLVILALARRFRSDDHAPGASRPSRFVKGRSKSRYARRPMVKNNPPSCPSARIQPS